MIQVVPDNTMYLVNTPAWVTQMNPAEQLAGLIGYQEVDVTSRCAILFKSNITDGSNIGQNVVAELYSKRYHQGFSETHHDPWNTAWPDELGCVGASEYTAVRKDRYSKFFAVNELLADDSGCLLVDGTGRSYLVKEVEIPLGGEIFEYRLVAFPLGNGNGFGTHTRIHETGSDAFVSVTASIGNPMSINVTRFTVSYDISGINISAPYITFREPDVSVLSVYTATHAESTEGWRNPFHLESGSDPDTGLPVALEPYLYSYYSSLDNEVVVFNLVRGGIDNQRTLVDLATQYEPLGGYVHDSYNYYDGFLSFCSTGHVPVYEAGLMKDEEHYGLAYLNLPVVADGPGSVGVGYHQILSHQAQGANFYGPGPVMNFYDYTTEPRTYKGSVPGYYTSEAKLQGVPVSQASLYGPVIKDGKLQLLMGVTYLYEWTGDTFFTDDSFFFGDYELRKSGSALEDHEWELAFPMWDRYQQSTVDHSRSEGDPVEVISLNVTRLFSVVLDLSFGGPVVTEVDDPDIYTYSNGESLMLSALPARTVHGMLPPTFSMNHLRLGRVGVYDRPCHGGANVVLVRKGEDSYLAWPDGTISPYPYAEEVSEGAVLINPDGESRYFVGGWSYLGDSYKYGVKNGGLLAVGYSMYDGRDSPFGDPGALYAWRYLVYEIDPPVPPVLVTFIPKVGRKSARGMFS